MNYDYIIIGAGSAGCVLANRLTENPETVVLLLEAGGQDKAQEVHIPAAFAKLFKSEHDWNYEAEGTTPDRKQYWPRGKMLGGSSSMNAMMIVRGNRQDYNHWRDLGNSGWGYEDVLPYFKKSEHYEGGRSAYHGADGPLHVSNLRSPNPVSEAFVAAGIEAGLTHNEDVNGADQEGVGLTPVMQKNGQRWSAADGYLKPALKRPNLTLQTQAHTTRILFDGRKAIAVEYLHQGQKQTANASREVLLCAGTINSPQILMLSGVGPATHLQKMGVKVVHDLPGVGRNLQDHVVAGIHHRCLEPVTLASAEKMSNILNYMLFKKGPLTSNAAEALAFIKTQPDLSIPDVELIFLPVFFMYHTFNNPEGHGFSIGSMLLRPQSRGVIVLQSTDPLAPPLIQPNTFSERADLRPIIEGIKLTRRLVQGQAMRPFLGEEISPGLSTISDEDLTRHICETFQTVYHPVGTCKMGSDGTAVVDTDLRVHGLERLRVVDASIMPTIIGGHIHAPTVMIAEKAAEMIKQGD